MKLHILVYASAGMSPYEVETFTSRTKMVSRRQVVKEKSKTVYMFPPIDIDRNVEGMLMLSSIINRIHSKGPVAVLEEMENGDD